jgi:hypothetical protein
LKELEQSVTYWWSGDNIELPMISVLCAEKGKRRGETEKK